METAVYKKIIGLLILLLVLVNCTSSESNNNEVPSDFIITINNINENSATITWTQSIDPQGSVVFYDLFLESEKLIDNTTDLSFTVENLIEDTVYSGEVIASDAEGNTISNTFTFETSLNQPPSSFNISIISSDPFYSRIEWTESLDPEGEDVTYNVYIEQELIAENLTNQYFIFNDLKGLTSYSGYVEAVDTFEKKTTTSFSFETSIKIYSSSLTLDSQSELDSFGNEGYNKIEGNLIIGSLNSNLTNVSNLSSLESLQVVTENLYIRNTICNNLIGLQNINLTYQYARLYIKNNMELLNINSLSAINNLHILEITSNENLTNNNGLSSLTSINHYAWINFNPLLTSISGFQNVQIIRDLEINHNDSLTNVNGLENITSANKFTIINNDNLNDLSGISNLASCSSLFIISGNHSLESLSNLSQLNSVDELHITENHSLTTLSGLENLTEIKYTIQVSGNENLQSLTGIENVIFTNNPANMHSILISNNNLITNLDPLDNYTFNRGGIIISNNPELSDFCGLTRIMTEIDEITNSPNNFIFNNNYNPTQLDIINGNCSN